MPTAITLRGANEQLTSILAIHLKYPPRLLLFQCVRPSHSIKLTKLFILLIIQWLPLRLHASDLFMTTTTKKNKKKQICVDYLTEKDTKEIETTLWAKGMGGKKLSRAWRHEERER